MCWDTDHALSGDGVTLFMQDEGLFASFELHNLNKLREMESDFGILPNPLYDETQDNYYSTINGNVASMLVFPSDCPDTERAAYTVDVMGAISKNILTPAYIESYLKGKVSRDNESEESINIVFDSIRYDLGFCYSWGNLGSFVQQLFEQKKEGLATAYQTTSKIGKRSDLRGIFYFTKESLLLFPAYFVLSVLENDALRGEEPSYLVGSRVVFRFFRVVSFADKTFRALPYPVVNSGGEARYAESRAHGCFLFFLEVRSELCGFVEE